jgi:cbb3-type cytochrome oxidase maturation protein
MNGLLLLIPIALAMGLAGLLAFLWALRSGQFDDLDGAAGRVLFDDVPSPPDTPRNPPLQPRSPSP